MGRGLHETAGRGKEEGKIEREIKKKQTAPEETEVDYR
jgi:hypothetical protein